MEVAFLDRHKKNLSNFKSLVGWLNIRVAWLVMKASFLVADRFRIIRGNSYFLPYLACQPTHFSWGKRGRELFLLIDGKFVAPWMPTIAWIQLVADWTSDVHLHLDTQAAVLIRRK